MSGWFISRNQRRTAETLVSRARSQCETSGISARAVAQHVLLCVAMVRIGNPEEKAVNPRVLLCAFHCAPCLQSRSFHGKSFVRITCATTCVARVNASPLLHEIHPVFAVPRNASQREHWHQRINISREDNDARFDGSIRLYTLV